MVASGLDYLKMCDFKLSSDNGYAYVVVIITIQLK